MSRETKAYLVRDKQGIFRHALNSSVTDCSNNVEKYPYFVIPVFNNLKLAKSYAGSLHEIYLIKIKTLKRIGGKK